jgi:hypothetical protein
LPTGKITRPLWPFITPAAEAYQAASAVMTPRMPPIWMRAVLWAANGGRAAVLVERFPMNRKI